MTQELTQKEINDAPEWATHAGYDAWPRLIYESVDFFHYPYKGGEKETQNGDILTSSIALPQKAPRHVHADLINWWTECPSENVIQLRGGNGYWNDTPCQPRWSTSSEYRKKPTDTELVIEDLFNTSAKVTAKYMDDLHCLAKKIHELKGNDNGADKGG